jgi:hypothetical protein
VLVVVVGEVQPSGARGGPGGVAGDDKARRLELVHDHRHAARPRHGHDGVVAGVDAVFRQLAACALS